MFLASAVEAASVSRLATLEVAPLSFSLLLQVVLAVVPALIQLEQHLREPPRANLTVVAPTKSTSSPRRDLLP